MAQLANNKSALKTYIEAQSLNASAQSKRSAADAFFAPDASINLVHPFNDMQGVAQYQQNFLQPLHSAFAHLSRTDYIAFGGSFAGQDWVTATGYYSGHFSKDWLGIQPTNRLEYLRFGEFHRMEDARAVESYIFLDIPELMIACGQWPQLPGPATQAGFVGYLPGPASADGLVWQVTESAISKAALERVEQMLKKLATADQAWRPYWHEDMRWYGPAAFGSFVGIENFAGFQVPFEQTFSEWIGGAMPGSKTRHFTRFADGNYVCSGGWPSLNAVQARPFLGQSSTGKRLYMRVCDWWRNAGDKLVENWVFVDIPHVLLQMGYDLFADRQQPA